MRKSTDNTSQNDAVIEMAAKKPLVEKSTKKAVSTSKKAPAKQEKSAPKKSASKPKTAESNAKKQTAKKAEAGAERARIADKKAQPEKKAETAVDISSKTPHVMRLVQPTEMINPVIVAGKSSIPKALRGVEPLSRMLRREAKQLDSAITGELVTINLTAVAIDESAAETLRRFNACDCPVCVEEFSRLTAEQVTARFVKLRPQDAELGSDKLEELKQPVKKQVIQQMIRIVIRNPKRSFHG